MQYIKCQLIKINVWSTVSCSIHSKIMPLTEVLKICFCRSYFPWFHSDTFWSFWNFFVFILWVTNIIYQNLMLLNFCCRKTCFLYKHSYISDQKYTQRNLDNKAQTCHESISYFMKCPWNGFSWNALKKKSQYIIALIKVLLVYNPKYSFFFLPGWYLFFCERYILSSLIKKPICYKNPANLRPYFNEFTS